MAELIGKNYVITEFFNVPYQDLFRYNKKWCVKISPWAYKNESDGWRYPIKHSINPSTLVIIHIKSFPKHKLYEIQ